MLLLGFDVGSSSVKASIVEAASGKCLGSAFYPKTEMEIKSVRPGWAEQEPEKWWAHAIKALDEAISIAGRKKEEITAIGISYQMHGLVLVDKDKKVLRPSIIWCDSRAVEIGNKAFENIGEEKCLAHLLNSPGNFTASKLKWVKDNEPELYEKIYKIMLPGDYIAMKLTGEINTTNTGLSEGIFFDFINNGISEDILKEFGYSEDIFPKVVDVFTTQGEVGQAAAQETGLNPGTKIAYRAGDQPNNAFSLNVLKPGEIAATAGTSGVIYGISEEVMYDPQSRVNTFAHVNHKEGQNRLGVLLCVNGTGILNSWVRKNVAAGMDYEQMNNLAASVPIGSEGLSILPFGNGAERMLGNQDKGACISNLNFNIHNQAHIIRAAQEGIAFAFKYGMEIMKETGIQPSIIRAGHANMFLSPLFRQTLANLSGAIIELYNTDGAQGAALGAGVGSGAYAGFDEAFKGLACVKTVQPEQADVAKTMEAFEKWILTLENQQ